MDKAKKHPEDELLAAYSAASLPLSQALCISTHLEHCPDCGRKLQRLNRVGSELMQQLKPAPAADELKNKLLDRLDSLSEENSQQTHPLPDSTVPRCLQQFVHGNYDDLPWRRVSADIRSVELCRDSNGARVELLKIKPGGSAITHTHLGDEYTVILEGSFSDEAGLYGEGDFLLRGKHDKHTPVASLHRDCLCLAVTEGPIQFTGFFSRLMNPFIRRSYA
ncbi:MAG TPA: ChrR family anti-sigma-E factor [Gammaproteobacteria bacterium]|nr:ChrR family anti-sigma-E factor [Gammaproteobacteria bacterium]